MKYTPAEHRLLLSEEQKLALLAQLRRCEAVRAVQQSQIQKTVDHNLSISDPGKRRKPVRVFGSPLNSLSAWTGGQSDGLWASVNMGMMGYPLADVVSPKWANRFTYRGPHKGIQQDSAGALYLSQMNQLGVLVVEGVTAPVASGFRLVSATFRLIPDTDQWYVSLNVSSKPLKIPAKRLL